MRTCQVNHPPTPGAVPFRPWFARPPACKAPPVNGSGLLIVLGVVVGGSLVVYAIVKLTGRW